MAVDTAAGETVDTAMDAVVAVTVDTTVINTASASVVLVVFTAQEFEVGRVKTVEQVTVARGHESKRGSRTQNLFPSIFLSTT